MLAHDLERRALEPGQRASVRVELAERWGAMADNLDQARDPEKTG
ncbi:MAG: hypothetical protein OXG37_03025 [Actinomycetia bacterium]|nr:hypothetical protein [Actinomycetes bacterium]